jgi:hypothetical protein
MPVLSHFGVFEGGADYPAPGRIIRPPILGDADASP